MSKSKILLRFCFKHKCISRRCKQVDPTNFKCISKEYKQVDPAVFKCISSGCKQVDPTVFKCISTGCKQVDSTIFRNKTTRLVFFGWSFQMKSTKTKTFTPCGEFRLHYLRQDYASSSSSMSSAVQSHQRYDVLMVCVCTEMPLGKMD